MPAPSRTRFLLLLLLGLHAGPAPRLAEAFPPALPHWIFGTIRDELGTPLAPGSAQVILETTSGVGIPAPIGQYGEGINYRLAVPMDTGFTGSPYKPSALQPFAPFRIRVRIGTATYLPIEMTGDYSKLGRSGGETRINLTLGVDADGDGLPDAWERALAARSGLPVEQIHPKDDLDHDGLSNLEEYLAGTYAYDDQDGFLLSIVRLKGANPVLAFTTIKRRSYSIYHSVDMRTWKRVPFIPTGESGAVESYPASDTRRLEVEVPVPGGSDEPGFFKLTAF